MENDIPISILLENAKKEMKQAVDDVRDRYRLRPCIMDVIVSSVLADIRSDAQGELIVASKEMIDKANEELVKAKEAAKKVLKAESGRAQEEVGENGSTGKADSMDKH